MRTMTLSGRFCGMPKPEQARSGTGAARIEMVPLGDLVLADRNPKLHDVAALRASIERFGFVWPLLVDEATGKMVAGHGRLQALAEIRAAGGQVPTRVVARPDGEWEVPVLRGVAFRDAREAEAYLIADNRLVEVGGWDDSVLAAMLSDLGPDLVALAGVTPEALADILATASPAPPSEFPEHGTDIPVDYRCPKCHYEWSGKPN